MTPLFVGEIAGPETPGEHFTLRGRVFDGEGQPVNDAVIEVWQANAAGKYAHPDDTQEKPLTPDFVGFGRSPTEEDGSFRFASIVPGRVPDTEGALQAPHLAVVVYMRGLLRQLVTRVYFPGDPANDADPILRLVPQERRATLIATRAGDGTLLWDIHLQGPDETVFFST
jgi:protocatechuate 3,4-dioxygenase alpha subunit